MRDTRIKRIKRYLDVVLMLEYAMIAGETLMRGILYLPALSLMLPISVCGVLEIFLRRND
jgi:hypothetical protein